MEVHPLDAITMDADDSILINRSTMRIGKKPSASRHWIKAGAQGKPKHISPEVVVGQLSPDIVSLCFAPRLTEVANAVLEHYADEVLLYEDALQELSQSVGENKTTANDESVEGEVEIEIDGSSVSPPQVDLDAIRPPNKPLFHSEFAIDEMKFVFKETSRHFFSKESGWKTQANAAKFERLMEEKYGVFRPFIKDNPQVEEAIRLIQRKYETGFFSPFRKSDPPIPKSTAVVILFMMQRGRLRWEIMVLSAVFFLVGLQPWALVLIVGTIQGLVARRKRAPIGKMKRPIPAVESYYEACQTTQEKHKILAETVGKQLNTVGENLIEYDTIILGSGAPALFTGALLTRAGRRILLLSPNEDASGCITMTENKKIPSMYKNVPFDIHNANLSKFSQQLNFLVPALCTRTDCQGGVRFARVGSTADNHAFEILEIPGIGPSGGTFKTILTADNTKEHLMEEAASHLGDGWPNSDGTTGNSVTGTYLNACEQINTSSSLFYASKIIADTVNNARGKSPYGECSTRYAASLLNQSFPLNSQARSLMAALGMRVENIRPKNASLAAHITHLSSVISGEGVYYPVGGPRALCHALANTIERNGGQVVTGARVKELLFLDSPQTSNTREPQTTVGGEGKNETTPGPQCVGVKLDDGRSLRFSDDMINKKGDKPVVISMTGLIDTFIRILPDEIRSRHKVPLGLPALSERRPYLKALFLLDGTSQDLQITGADYYRLPNAARALDQMDQQTGQVTYGDIGWSDDATPAENLDDAINAQEDTNSNTTSSDEARTKGKRPVQFENGKSWMSISFPSAKDPSFEERHGKVSTCVVTIEADDDIVRCFESKPKLYVAKQSAQGRKIYFDRLLDRVRRDVIDLYPQLEGKIIHAEISNTLDRALMQNPERYAAKGVRADTPYPGLYLGGSDLTVNGSLSASIVGGWLAANAVAGYSYIDFLFLQKNITSDIAQFLERPDIDEEDLAVPINPVAYDDGKDTEQEEHKA